MRPFLRRGLRGAPGARYTFGPATMKESTPRLVVTLTLVCAASAALVALVGAVTAAPIAEARARDEAESLLQVLPPGSPAPEMRAALAPDGSTNFTYWAAGDAVAMEVSSNRGYAGRIRLLVGFGADGRLHRFKVLEHAETPGLGAKLADDKTPVLASASGRPAAGTDWRVRKDGGDIDAITAATITSRAACEALALAAERLAELRPAP